MQMQEPLETGFQKGEMADRVGFEPTEDGVSALSGFQDRHHKPLGHLSIFLIYLLSGEVAIKFFPKNFSKHQRNCVFLADDILDRPLS